MTHRSFRGFAFAAALAVSVVVAACDGGSSAPDTTAVSRAVAVAKADQATGTFSCGISGPQNDACVIRFTREGTIDTYSIEQPIVDRESAIYGLIRFFPGDTVIVEAGGCVQTGGHGDTWKRYVNPSGDGSGHLYFGRMEIGGVLGPTRFDKLPPSIKIPEGRFASTGLRLHYADDNYGDNGYWGHADDTGNNNQCSMLNGADGGPAHVKITIVRAIPQPLPQQIPSEQGKLWDLVENLKPGDPGVYDDNGLFFNPRWRWQRPGNEPVTFDRNKGAAESSQHVIEDNPENSIFNFKRFSPACKSLVGPVAGAATGGVTGEVVGAALEKMWGHFNWFNVTVTGQVYWDAHDGSLVLGDDDYNMYMITSVLADGPQVTGPSGKQQILRAGVTPDNNYLLQENILTPPQEIEKAIKLEFDSDEVIDAGILGMTPWWRQLIDDVDSDVDSQARSHMDGHNAIVIGLMGLDVFHGGPSEIHPVHALAVQTDSSRVVQNDAWAIFVRNWGDEGECSKDQHFIDLQSIRIRIPRPEHVSATARAHIHPSTRFIGHNLGDQSITPRKFEVYSQAGGDAIVIFHLPPAQEDGGLIGGELHLDWFSSDDVELVQRPISTEGDSGSVPTRRNPPPIDQQAEEGEQDGEAILRNIWLGMTEQQRAAYQTRLKALLPARGPSTVDTLTVELLDALPPATPSLMPSVPTAPATRKIARDQARAFAVCATAANIVKANGGDCSLLNPSASPPPGNFHNKGHGDRGGSHGRHELHEETFVERR